MSEQSKNQANQNAPLSDDDLKNVSGGNKIQKQRLEALDTRDSSKSVDNIQQERLDAWDARDSSK